MTRETKATLGRREAASPHEASVGGLHSDIQTGVTRILGSTVRKRRNGVAYSHGLSGRVCLLYIFGGRCGNALSDPRKTRAHLTSPSPYR